MRSLSLFLASCALAFAQVPRIGLIQIYGLRKVSEQDVRRALGVSEGDRLPASKGAVEDQIRALPEVLNARLEAVCCAGDRSILYVGIEETGAPRFELRATPLERVSLPEDVAAAYEKLAGTRSMKLDRLAEDNLQNLKEVLHDSWDPAQRIIAATLLQHAEPSPAVVAALESALRDPDDFVQSAAFRSLDVIASSAPNLQPSSAVLIEMLHSASWTTRERAAEKLAALTAHDGKAVLDEIRTRALGPVLEMARWKTPAHAQAAFTLAGRIAGIPEKEIAENWSRGDREPVLKRALADGAAAAK